jgi:hypothetical protein
MRTLHRKENCEHSDHIGTHRKPNKPASVDALLLPRVALRAYLGKGGGGRHNDQELACT